MRLELKILAILFLLVGIYAGVTLLPGRKTDEREGVPEGLVLARYWEEPLPPKYQGWVYSGEDENNNLEYRCPYGYNDPGKDTEVEDLEVFGPEDEKRNITNFLQKHFCPWCYAPRFGANYRDALLFSRRRGSFGEQNTVILGLTLQDAGWRKWTYENPEKEDSTRDFCTHEYTTVVKCFIHPPFDVSLPEPKPDDYCVLVGRQCQTFHSPYYHQEHHDHDRSGHLEDIAHCLDSPSRWPTVGDGDVDDQGNRYEKVNVKAIQMK